MKKCFLLPLLALGMSLSAQNHAKDWHLRHNPADTNLGIGLHRALSSMPVPAGAKTVIVAVIDDGVDVSHPDLKDNIWTNTAEVPGNGVDDDHNGYTDDIHGWDYLGNMGGDIEFDNLEMVRLLREYRKRFEGKKTGDIARSEKNDYKTWKKLEGLYKKELEDAQSHYKTMQFYKKLSDALSDELDSISITLKQLEEFEPKKVEAKYGKSIAMSVCSSSGISPREFFEGIREDYEHSYDKVNYHLNPDFDPRPQVGDYYNDASTLGYGNHDVKGPDGRHGTHVAGIIAALRNNGIGMDGISPLVKIMALRVVPNGDERDKDVAHAIRYAADNGASVINMSFGKNYSFNSAVVQEAIRYAESKDVLMVHAAGNDGSNNDKTPLYPTAVFAADSVCKTWIEVGASDRDQTAAGFSNYGAKTVHVFAPGVQIYSTISNGEYKAFDGTSMASPVVAGLAALIRAYYPNLSAIQVKQVIESSVVKPAGKVKMPGKKRKKVRYSKLCSSAGIINAEQALKAAAAL